MKLRSGRAIRAKRVVLALGVQGNPRKLGVPGDSLPFVTNTLESADEHRNETIVIVGAGDSAIEDALALSRQNRVVLVNRGTEFARAKESNATQILRAIKNGQVECVYQGQAASRSSEAAAEGTPPARVTIASPARRRRVPCHMLITRLGAIPRATSWSPSACASCRRSPDSLPELSPQLRNERAGRVHHRRAGGLSAHQAGDEPGLRGHRVPARQRGGARRSRRAAEEARRAALRGRARRCGSGARRHPAARSPVPRGEAAGRCASSPSSSRIVGPKSGSDAVQAAATIRPPIYNILDGEVHLYADNVRLMTLRRGQVFGEMSLISGRPHDVTAVAGDRCVLLESPHTAVRKLMRVEASVRDYLDRNLHPARAAGCSCSRTPRRKQFTSSRRPRRSIACRGRAAVQRRRCGRSVSTSCAAAR